MNIKKTKTLNERNDIDEKIFNNEKWISGRVRDLEDVCGGEKSRKKIKYIWEGIETVQCGQKIKMSKRVRDGVGRWLGQRASRKY